MNVHKFVWKNLVNQNARWNGEIYNLLKTTEENLQIYHPRCVLCKWVWVGPSKHNCLSNVIYYDDMLRPYLAIFRSISYLKINSSEEKRIHMLT
jgi:hypothetical protein